MSLACSKLENKIHSIRLHMQILFRFCLLIVVCSVLELYKRLLQVSLGLFLMDFASLINFGCGFLVFGCFSHVFNILGLLLMFYLGLFVLHFTWHGISLVPFLFVSRVKSSENLYGFGSKIVLDQVCDPKVSSNESNSPKFVENRKSPVNVDASVVENELVNMDVEFNRKDDVEEEKEEFDHDNDNNQLCFEDEEFDVVALRRLVKTERQRAKMAYLELEKERMAAASAADEAMAMIMRLQGGKSSLEIEFNQYRRSAEQKQEYNQEVIQSLKWIMMKHETQSMALLEQLKLCKQKLKLYVKEDELEQFEEVEASSSLLYSTMRDGFDDEVVSPLDWSRFDMEVLNCA